MPGNSRLSPQQLKATLNTSGTGVLTYAPNLPSGEYNIISVQWVTPPYPASAQGLVSINGIPVGVLASSASYGPITMYPNDVVTITVTGGNPSSTVIAALNGYSATQLPDPPLIPEFSAAAGSPPINFVNATVGGPGSEVTYTTTAAGTLINATMALITSATVANRFPNLVIGKYPLELPFSSAAIPASSVASFSLWVGGPTPPVLWAANLALNQLYNGGLPQSLYVPAGTLIETSTVGLQATDQYDYLTLCFVPA